MHHPFRNCSFQLDRSFNTDICPQVFSPYWKSNQSYTWRRFPYPASPGGPTHVCTCLFSNQLIENRVNHTSRVGPLVSILSSLYIQADQFTSIQTIIFLHSAVYILRLHFDLQPDSQSSPFCCLHIQQGSYPTSPSEYMMKLQIVLKASHVYSQQ